MFGIEVRNGAGVILANAQGIADARLIYREPYQPGDTLCFYANNSFTWASVDQAVEPGFLYAPNKAFTFSIPFGDAKNGYPPQSFSGDLHAIWISPATKEEAKARRNVAKNPIAQRKETGGYPFASANVETRGEAQFWARNAIDGHRFNERHGGWPYHSWGIGERKDAWLHVDFGRTVEIDEVGIVLRADFPHDAWWEKGEIECSDGSAVSLALTKTAEIQMFPIAPRSVSWLILKGLCKADDPSPFPALTQIEVYGHDV